MLGVEITQATAENVNSTNSKFDAIETAIDKVTQQAKRIRQMHEEEVSTSQDQ